MESYDSHGNATQTTITYSGNTGAVIQSNQTYTTAALTNTAKGGIPDVIY